MHANEHNAYRIRQISRVSCTCVVYMFWISRDVVEIFRFWLNNNNNNQISLFNNGNQGKMFHLSLWRFILFGLQLLYMYIWSAWEDSRWNIVTRGASTTQLLQQHHSLHASDFRPVTLNACMSFLFPILFVLISFEILCLFVALRRLSFVTMVNIVLSFGWSKLCKVEMRALANKMRWDGTEKASERARMVKVV